ncbi:MAG: hypothetical protein ABIH70_08895 [Chloroflexota bacterium]
MMPDTLPKDELCQFVNEFADDQCSLELIQFWGRHPHTRFSQLTLIHAFDRRRSETERTLRRLIAKGLVKTSTGNGVIFYWLTETEPLRSLVLRLTELDWYQWQLLLKEIYLRDSSDLLLTIPQ